MRAARSTVVVVVGLLSFASFGLAERYVARLQPDGLGPLLRALPPGGRLLRAPGLTGRVVLELPDRGSAAALRAHGGVRWLEADGLVTASDVGGTGFLPYETCPATSIDDEEVQGQAAFAEVDVPEFQELTEGESIVVAVVDTGVDYDHPDGAFTGQLLSGYDFRNDDADPQDDAGHGTGVAGIIVEIVREVEILPVKVLDSDGSGYFSDVADGIEWAVDQGADVVNLSLGGHTNSQAIQDAVEYAHAYDVLIVGAAGNDDSGQAFYPAAYPEVVGVAGLDDDGVRADFGSGYKSNYHSLLDVSAPAIDIATTYWPDNFVWMKGTSAAAAFASAILAGELALSKSPGEAVSDLVATAVDVDSLNPGYEGLLGSGRVSAEEAAQ